MAGLSIMVRGGVTVSITSSKSFSSLVAQGPNAKLFKGKRYYGHTSQNLDPLEEEKKLQDMKKKKSKAMVNKILLRHQKFMETGRLHSLESTNQTLEIAS